jgi:site-specific DNA recombinase
VRPEKRQKENGNGNGSAGLTSTRCAIYTRKSTEEGLEQSFNTLDAQRDAGESFINSQHSEGWVALPQKYDDGGYTGANMDRPALKRLLSDVQSGVVNCVVVYKVDRLTRSLLDFARIIEILDKSNATFASVTQQFNTTTSLGRLTLNILLSFAHNAERAIMQSQGVESAAGRLVSDVGLRIISGSAGTAPGDCPVRRRLDGGLFHPFAGAASRSLKPAR